MNFMNSNKSKSYGNLLGLNYVFLVLLAFCSYPRDASSTYPSATPYTKSTEPNPEFVPAMPGKTPSCLKDPRLTFCLEPEKYPKKRILYLLENKMYDVDTFLKDETRDTYTFEAREAYSLSKVGYSYHRPTPSSRYLPPSLNVSTGYERRPTTKYGVPYGVKSHAPTHPNSFAPSTTPSLNSFSSSYTIKHDVPSYAYGRQSTAPHYIEGGPYPRYPRNTQDSTVTPQQPPSPQQTWLKQVLRRHKRQANLSELCPARAAYIMPRAAQSVEGDWMFLVNVNERYTQLVKSETCIQNTCTGACDVPEGFSAICQQQYVQKRLVALDGSGSKLNSDTFWFPSCCICRIRANTG